jgi:hypothetical protein
MKFQGGDLVFSTGKRVYCHANIVGIDDAGETFEGYDGGIESDKLTMAERIELADEMIARWQLYKNGTAG